MKKAKSGKGAKRDHEFDISDQVVLKAKQVLRASQDDATALDTSTKKLVSTLEQVEGRLKPHHLELYAADYSTAQGNSGRDGPRCMSHPVGGARRPGPRTGEILRNGLPRFGQGLAVRRQPDAHVNRSVLKIHDVLLCVGVAFFCLTMQNAKRHVVAVRASGGTE